MAASQLSFKIAGFTAVGVHTTGVGALGVLAVDLMDNGSLVFIDAAGNRVVVEENPQLNRILQAVLVGASATIATKKFHS